MASLGNLHAAEIDERAQAFIEAHVKKMRPLDVTSGIAWWNANTTGKDEDFKKKEDAQNAIDAALADTKTFGELKAIKTAGVKDKLLARQIDLLYLQYLEKQLDPELL